MDLNKLLKVLDAELPLNSALEGDRVGLQVQTNKDIKKILVCLELNDDLLSEAIEQKVDLVISFHPLIYSPLKFIDLSERVSRLVAGLIKNEIGLYVVHTTFDVHSKGSNKIISDLIGLTNQEFLFPSGDHENRGMGMMGDFNGSLIDLLEKAKNVFNSPIKFNGDLNKKVNKVAVIGGSGSSFLNEISHNTIDVLITSDVSYHTYHSITGKLIIIDPGHYEMEQFVSQGIIEIFKEKLKDISFITGKSLSNPVRYYPDNDYTDKQKKYLNNL